MPIVFVVVNAWAAVGLPFSGPVMVASVHAADILLFTSVLGHVAAVT